MKVIFYNKICDRVPECGGIAACPAGALYFDEAAGKIRWDESKCVGCGACVSGCPIGAIKIARTIEEEKAIAREISEDPRREEDLFCDRYGADWTGNPAVNVFEPPAELTALHLLRGEDIRCLLNGIPFKSFFDGKVIKMIDPSDGQMAAAGVSELPALVFYKDKKKIGAIQGFYENNGAEPELLKKKTAEILGGDFNCRLKKETLMSESFMPFNWNWVVHCMFEAQCRNFKESPLYGKGTCERLDNDDCRYRPHTRRTNRRRECGECDSLQSRILADRLSRGGL